MSIPSPYNFVPLSDKVYFPDWADRVSMDVPFSDGISGTLEIKVTAKTPIYIRNGGAHPEDSAGKRNSAQYKDFFRASPDGPYAIPGSSLKGMLRNVVEIITYSKIAGTGKDTARVSEHRYAIRDLYNKDYTTEITEQTPQGYKPKVRAGWLSGKDGEWMVTLCDFARVEQEALETYFGQKEKRTISLGDRGPAEGKYRQIPEYTKISFTCGRETGHPHSRGNKLVYKKAENLGKGDREGTLVFTGQPARRDGKPGKKHMEFIFFDNEENAIPVPKEIKKEFEFTHSELGENRKANKEWAFWKRHLGNEEGVPVFLLFEGKSIKSMGLALMYRLPYTHSILETVAHTSGDHLDGKRPDFGEMLFGRVEDTDALRGRVSVETFVAEGHPSPLPRVDTVLGAPKPTFYPNYVKQKANAEGTVNQYSTYMHKNAEIRGWKRYIVQPDAAQKNAPRAPTQNVETFFQPLPQGTTFIGSIHLHNVKPAELGALLWSLTWGGDTSLRHSLGMAKPYGFGSVALSITSSSIAWCNPLKGGAPSLDECKKLFIETMSTWLGQPWEKSDAVAAVKAMANPSTRWSQELRYPHLDQRTNEFADFKKQQASLIPVVAERAGGQARQQPLSAPATNRAPTPAAQKKPADLFIEEFATTSLKKIPERLKYYKLEPDKVSPDEKKRIYEKLKSKLANQPLYASLLKQWKP